MSLGYMGATNTNIQNKNKQPHTYIHTYIHNKQINASYWRIQKILMRISTQIVVGECLYKYSHQYLFPLFLILYLGSYPSSLTIKSRPAHRLLRLKIPRIPNLLGKGFIVSPPHASPQNPPHQPSQPSQSGPPHCPLVRLAIYNHVCRVPPFFIRKYMNHNFLTDQVPISIFLKLSL